MGRPVTAALAAVAGLAVAAAAAACGPSFQAIHEGSSRFEHCYALEEDPRTAMHEKADCWRDWSEHYTFGQTRDRIQYATARYVALSQANVPTDEALMMAAPGVTPRVSTITAPAPTNAFAPPPKVLDADGGEGTPTVQMGDQSPGHLPEIDAGAPEVTTVELPAPLPAAACTDACGATFRDCASGCVAVPGPQSKDRACPTCEKKYKACVRACLK